MRSLNRLASGLLLGGLLALGTACNPPTFVERPTSVNAIQPDQGVVFLSLTANTSRAGQFDSIRVQRLASAGQPAADYILSESNPGLSRDTSLYVGALPEGEYALTLLHSGNQFVSLGAKSQDLLGHFKVEAGTTADLGRLVLTGFNEHVLTGRSALVHDNADLLRLTTPDLLALLQRRKGTGWTTPRAKDDQVEAYGRATPVGADGLKELSGGFVAAGSRLGLILVRSPKGQWAGLHTETLASILDVAPEEGEDRRLVAVGEFRTLVRVDSHWKATFLDPGDLPPGNLFFIGGNEASGWIVGHQAGTTLQFFRSPRLEAGTWKPIRQEVVKDSIWSGQNHVWAWATPTGLAYATSFGGMHTYDAKQDRWSDVLLPKQCNLLDLSIQDRWSILTSPGGGFAGIFASLYTSSDQGQTWLELEGPFKAKARPACVMPAGRILLQGGLKSAELQLSTDGGKTWGPTLSAVSVHANLVATPTQGVFAIDDGGSSFGLASIDHSADGGKTWRTEFSTFNRAAYDRDHPSKP